MPDRASGFCVYNDCAVAISWLLDHGFDRIAYVDVDVHHGDGPQAIFYDDPRVLTISIHEFAPELGFFPGTGSPDEHGGPNAPGSAINVPLAPGTDDAGWLAAFRDTVPTAVRDFGPDVLVTQLGCDTHASDPLAHLQLTTATYRRAAAILHELAHEAAGGRWVATEMAEVELADPLPASWVAQATALSGGSVPATLYDPAGGLP